MTKSPIINAASAALYISAVASLMFYSPKFEDTVQSVIVPIAILSLFVLSAAVMGFIFFYQPIRLYFEDKKVEAVHLFLKTVGFFAGITFVIFCILFFLSKM